MQALRSFCKEVGVPTTLVCDPHATQKSGAVRKFLYEVGTTLRVLERATQWANLAERFIGLLKNGVRADLRESDAPLVLWDYCMERRVKIMNLTARGNHKLQGLNPYTKTFHETADISNICNFGCSMSGTIIVRIVGRRITSSPRRWTSWGGVLDRVRITVMRCVSGYCVVSSGIVKPCRTIVRENV